MGLFDQSYGALLDPQTVGILSAAMSGLQASGPSTMPRSLGQIAGMAGQAGLGAFAQAQQQAVLQSLMKQHTALYEAQIQKMKTEEAMRQRMMPLFERAASSEGGGDRNALANQLESLGVLNQAMGHPTGAAAIAIAERIRDRERNKAAVEALKEKPMALSPEAAVAGTNFMPPNPGQVPPQDLAAFQAAARQAALGGVGRAMPQAEPPTGMAPAPVVQGNPLGGGRFSPLMMSQIPQLRREALIEQIRANQQPTSTPAKEIEDRASKLADKETAIVTRPDPMKIVIGSDGQPVYAPGSGVGGMRPGSPMSSTQGINPEHANLHGEEYLSTLPPGLQNTVRGLINYKLPLTALSSRTGERNIIYQHAEQTDPNFNVAKYTQRQKVMNDFTSGVQARNIVAIDQSINHMGTLYKLGDALENKDYPAINAIVNAVRTQTGDPRVNNFDTAKQAVGTELMRVFRQVNASEVETKAWEDRFRAASSPAQIKGAIKVAADLLVGRLSALNNQWNRGMDVDTGYPRILSPEAASALDSFGGKKPGEHTPSGAGWTDEKERRFQELLRKQRGS